MSQLDTFYNLQTNFFIALDQSKVNLDDICNSNRPGSIIRCSDVNALRVFVTQNDCLGLVGGLISEEE